MLMGILAGWCEAGDRTRNTWTCGGSWTCDGETIRGYAVIVDGRVQEVIAPDTEGAITQAVTKVREVAKSFADPCVITEVAMGMQPFQVINSAQREDHKP